MFESNDVPSVSTQATSTRRLSSVGRKAAQVIRGLGVMALLLQSPAFATDPIDADPDPDFFTSTTTTTTTTIVVDSLDQVDLQGLAPGHYLIVVMGSSGVELTFEFVVD